MKRALFAAALCWTVSGHAAPGDGELPAAVDMRADAQQAARQGKPIVILFSLPDCAYCKVVRENYLAPLLRTSDVSRQPLIREASLASDALVTDFAGETLSQRGLGAKYGVHFAPTVLFLGPNGRLLVDPIIGGDNTGLYGGYLDNAFDAARRKLRDTKGETK